MQQARKPLCRRGGLRQPLLPPQDATQAHFYFCRSQAVSAHIHHIVHAPHYPDVAIIIFACAVACEENTPLGSLRKLIPVRFLALVVPKDRAQHDGCTDASPPNIHPVCTNNGEPSLFTTSAKIPGSGFVAVPGFTLRLPERENIIAPVSVCHHVSTMGHAFRRCSCDTTSTPQG